MRIYVSDYDPQLCIGLSHLRTSDDGPGIEEGMNPLSAAMTALEPLELALGSSRQRTVLCKTPRRPIAEPRGTLEPADGPHALCPYATGEKIDMTCYGCGQPCSIQVAAWPLLVPPVCAV